MPKKKNDGATRKSTKRKVDDPDTSKKAKERKKDQTNESKDVGQQQDGEELSPEVTEESLPNDCADLPSSFRTGVYTIRPSCSARFDVYCDMVTDGGGWTVFQYRFDGKTDFYRDWVSYGNGFGDLVAEFWLGNSKLSMITASGVYKLRIDLEDFQNNTRYALYSSFNVGDASSKYKLQVSGYSGTAGDSIAGGVGQRHDGMEFTTYDNDNDEDTMENCAVNYKGAWWYKGCHASNLNGLYLMGVHSSYADGIEWESWTGLHYSLKTTKMMIKRKN